MVISQQRALGTHTTILVFCFHACLIYDWDALHMQIILVTLMLVHVSSKNVPIDTFNILFERTQNKHNMEPKIPERR